MKSNELLALPQGQHTLHRPLLRADRLPRRYVIPRRAQPHGAGQRRVYGGGIVRAVRRLRLRGLLQPEPAEYKDERYAALIEGLYAQQTKETRDLGEEYRESRDFMAAWAHEAKTPVAAARLLLEACADDAAKESLAAEIDRINGNIERILYYSRSDSFSRDYIIAEENLAKLVKENVKKHAALFIRKHIKISIIVPESLTVFTDRKWLLFIMDQLLSNALKYTGENGNIAVSARQGDDETVLRYTDDGAGIAEADIGRIFDKSFTGELGREPGSSATGLGLYLAQKLARKLGHSIAVASSPGRGTAAEIHFPFIDDYYNLT
jgi:signal transduction histidine kinase